MIKRGFNSGEHKRSWLKAPLPWAMLIAECLLLLLASAYGDLFAAGNAARFVVLVLAAGVFYFIAIASYEKAPAESRPALLWGMSATLRLAVLLMPPGDDFWRYLWEGKIQLHGFNPYLLTPDAPALAGLRESWWGAIGHRDHAAICPPGGEWIFAHLVGTANWYALAPGFLPLLFKFVFALADMGTIWVLLKLNTGSRRYRVTAWYAWNPAVVLAFAGAGHYDSLMVFAMVAAAWLLHRANPLGHCKPAWDWALYSAAALGIAISIKPAPLVLLPVWIMALRKRSIVLGLSLAIPLGLALPYGGIDVVTQTFRGFLNVARFNDLVWWAVERCVWVNPNYHNTWYTVILALAVLASAWVFRNDWRTGALWALGSALVLAPVLYPWYVIWILPFACWRKAFPWFLFALTITLALLPWGNPSASAPWTESPIWARLLMAGPPLAWWILARKRALGEA